MYTFISVLILCPEILKILMKGKGHYSISYYLFTFKILMKGKENYSISYYLYTFYRQYSDSIR